MVLAKLKRKKWILLGTLSEAMDAVESQLIADGESYRRSHNLIIDDGGVPIIFIPITWEEAKRRFYGL